MPATFVAPTNPAATRIDVPFEGTRLVCAPGATNPANLARPVIEPFAARGQPRSRRQMIIGALSTRGDEASGTPVHPDTGNTVSSQLEAVQRAQAQQAAVMQLLESRISDMLNERRRGSEICTALSDRNGNQIQPTAIPPTSAAASRAPTRGVSNGQLRKGSWTWDPQVQGDLEQSFEVLRSICRRKCTLGSSRRSRNGRRDRATSPASSMASPATSTREASPANSQELARRRKQKPSRTSPEGTPEVRRRSPICSPSAARRSDKSQSKASDDDNGNKRRVSSLSASGLLAKWTHAKTRPRQRRSSSDLVAMLRSLLSKHDAPRGKTVVLNKRFSKPSRMLRSSWLFRQRVAGRLTRRDLLRHPCGAVCSLPFCKHLPTLPPDSNVGHVLDVLTALAIVYVATFTPLQVAFYSIFDALPWHLANLATELLFPLCIAIKFRRGFNYDGIRVSDTHFIALHYLRGDFAADVVASFP
jgi:hypothetical protein